MRRTLTACLLFKIKLGCVTMQYKALNKKAIGCMRLNAIIWSVILAFSGINTVVILSKGFKIPTAIYITLGVLIVLMIIYDIVTPIIRYKRYRYFIDDEMFMVVEGLWFIKKSIAPIERIHQIEVSRGPIDRMFGLSKVVITTAGGVVAIKFLENKLADEIADKLKNRINNIVNEQGVNNNG
ncbi:MAG: hypothetical protein EOM05_05430 [Clostridia bacterium]|nr:hypothetical protein [Clostridia bacterium]